MIEEQLPQEPETVSEAKPARRWTIWVAAGGCAVLICAAAFVGALVFAGPQIVQRFFPGQVQVAGELPRDMTHVNTMGDPNAPVHIIEYGDFQCPFCLKFWNESEPRLIEEYVNTGKVYFEYRSVGSFLGPESGWAAEGAYCAGDQGKFWEYHDTLFANWTGENVGDFTKENLIKYANSLQLDSAKFESCINEEKHKSTVEQDAVNARADGVHATPMFLINGYKVEGAQPYEIIKHVIDEILNGRTPGSMNG